MLLTRLLLLFVTSPLILELYIKMRRRNGSFEREIRKIVNESLEGFNDVTKPLKRNAEDLAQEQLKDATISGSESHGLFGVQEFDSNVSIGADRSDIIVALDYAGEEKEIRYPKREIDGLDTYKYVKKHFRNDVIDPNMMAYTNDYPAKTYVGLNKGFKRTRVTAKTIITDDPTHDVIKAGTNLSDLVPSKRFSDLFDIDAVKKQSGIVFVKYVKSAYELAKSFSDRGVDKADVGLEDEPFVRKSDLREIVNSEFKGLLYEILHAFDGYIVGVEEGRRKGGFFIKNMSPRKAATALNKVDMSDYNTFLGKSWKPSKNMQFNRVKVDI